jgi:acyl-CoA synthetase (AMP-forming)/AMP-acid ligase II
MKAGEREQARAAFGITELPPELVGMPATVPQLLSAREGEPDNPFVITADERLTYGEADRRSAELAVGLLDEGVGKETRVGVLYPNGVDWVVSWLAAARIGALTVPLSTFAPGRELARTIQHTDVQYLIMASSFDGQSLCERMESGFEGLADSTCEIQLSGAPYLRRIWMGDAGRPSWAGRVPNSGHGDLLGRVEAEVRASDLLAIVNTSGATATPKSVVHTHGSLVRHACAMAKLRQFDATDCIFTPAPLFWVGGLTMALLAAMASGASVALQERFQPGSALDLIEAARATQISCWPPAARALADHPSFSERDLSSIRGGTLVEALPPDVRPETPSASPLLASLGMTETGGPHTAADDPYAPLPPERQGSFGRALPGVAHAIDSDGSDMTSPRSEGEILVRGPFVMDGLYKRERFEIFTTDGWYPTGDRGWFDDEGFLHFTGRGNAMIKTAGSNVSPEEVEATIRGLPGVSDVFVLGLPHPVRGEEVAAAVVLKPSSMLEEGDVVSHARSELASYKVPRHICLIDESQVPLLPTGKVDRISLVQLFDDRAS